MAEPFREENGTAVLIVEPDRFPVSERGRTNPEVDHDIDDRATYAADILRLTRRDIGDGAKLAWGIFSLIPLVPFLYVLTGGDLW